MSKNDMKQAQSGTIRKARMNSAARAGLAVLGIGLALGVALVVCMDQIMKKIFVNEDWPEEEWSNDDWAGEELES